MRGEEISVFFGIPKQHNKIVFDANVGQNLAKVFEAHAAALAGHEYGFQAHSPFMATMFFALPSRISTHSRMESPMAALISFRFMSHHFTHLSGSMSHFFAHLSGFCQSPVNEVDCQSSPPTGVQFNKEC